jgi:hypothetical protein
MRRQVFGGAFFDARLNGHYGPQPRHRMIGYPSLAGTHDSTLKG